MRKLDSNQENVFICPCANCMEIYEFRDLCELIKIPEKITSQAQNIMSDECEPFCYNIKCKNLECRNEFHVLCHYHFYGDFNGIVGVEVNALEFQEIELISLEEYIEHQIKYLCSPSISECSIKTKEKVKMLIERLEALIKLKQLEKI